MVTIADSMRSLAYDEFGNLTEDKKSCDYEYDYENRIIKTTKDGNDIAEFAYDALGRRIRKIDSIAGTTRLYYYNDKWQVLTETDASETMKAWYAYGNYIDEVLLTAPIKIPMLTRCYVHDHLYSPAALTTASGTVQERYEYDAYGQPTIWDASFSTERSSSSYSNPYYFTGRRVDFLDGGDLTLQINRNRHYDYYSGRWLTHDPRGYVDGMNLYEYVQSQPVFLLDPGGMGAYSSGSTLPAHPPPDPGAGPHGATSPPSLKDWLYHDAWSAVAWAVRGWLPDASRHMRYYLDNTGKELTVRVGSMVSTSPKAKKHFYDELNDAMEWVEKNVKCGQTKSFVGTWTGGLNTKATSRNWFYAVGGYSACGSGRGTSMGSCGSGGCSYTMEFSFHFWDKYNWDTGKGVQIGIVSVKDTSLGKLHKEGIAQEFEMTGKTTTGVGWTKGQRFTEEGALTPDSSGRRCRR